MTAHQPAPTDALVHLGQPGVGAAARDYRTKNGRLRKQPARSVTTNQERPMGSTPATATASALKITSGPYAGFDARSIRAEIVIVTPEMAATLRKTCHFERQREIKQSNVERLLVEGKRGTFIAGTPIFIGVLPDMSMHILNGNHTLEMVIALGHAVPLTFIYARVENLHVAGEIYATFDIHRMRSWLEGLKAVGVGEDVEMASTMLPALGLIIQGFAAAPSENSVSRDVRFGMLRDYKDASAILAGAMRDAPTSNQRIVKHATNFCVALATTKYQPTEGAEFWGGIAHDNGLASNDPRKALLRFGLNVKNRSAATRTDRIRAAILAWNAWFRKEPLEYCKPNQVKHLRILGTPFDGSIVQPRRARVAAAADPLPEKLASGPMFVTGARVADTGVAQVTMFQG